MQSRVYLSNEQLRSYEFTVNTCNGHVINFVLSDVSDDSVGPEYEYIAYDELGYVCWRSYSDYDLLLRTEDEIKRWKHHLQYEYFAKSYLNYQIVATKLGSSLVYRYASSLTIFEEFFMPHSGTVWIKLSKEDIQNLI